MLPLLAVPSEDARCVASFISFRWCFCDDCFVELALSFELPVSMRCLALLTDLSVCLNGWRWDEAPPESVRHSGGEIAVSLSELF